VSDVTASLVEAQLPTTTSIRPLGRYRLSGFAEPASIFQISVDGLSEDFPALRTARAASQLPASLSDFVGRVDEIASALAILAQHRLLTLTGPGGTGKTRLSLEIARQAEPNYADGAYFVSLASLRDVDLIPATILDEIKVIRAGTVDPWEHLKRQLESRQMLMILDNFEQLTEGSSMVGDLLAAAPELVLIVTSRSPLRVAGERELPVPPLGVPGEGQRVARAEDADGVRLFVNRAEAVRPDFSLDDGNVAVVSQIVRSLDGLPLAIELAASRLRSLTPELVLDRLGNQLLTSRSADLPARQQTIVNAIGWSYDLLVDVRKRLLEELSVFSGSFGLNEAELVCMDHPDVLDGITELVEQSLLRQLSASGEPRFRMLTVIREFAYGALVTRGADRDVLDRHADVYLGLAERADVEILTSRRQQWLERLSSDHDNLRAAFDHAVTIGDADRALRLTGSLWRFWQMAGYLREGLQRLETALGMSGPSAPASRARALTAMGGLLYWQGEWEATLAPYREALEIYREVGDTAEIADAVYNLSFPVSHTADLDAAESLLRESLVLSESIDRKIGVGRAFWGLGNVDVFREEWDSAIEANKRAVEEFSQLDAPYDLGWAWFMLGHTNIRKGATEEAIPPTSNSLDLFADVGDVSALALIIDLVSELMLVSSDRESASYFAGAQTRIKVDTGIGISDAEVNQYPGVKEFYKSMDDLDRASFDEGYNAPLDDVIEKARAALASRG
jgi:predicted ATPase